MRIGLLLLACSASCARPGAARRVTCHQAIPPAVKAEMTEAASFNERNSRAALAEVKLTPTPLASRQVGSWSYEAMPEDTSQHAPGTTFEEDGKTWVAGPFISVPNGQLADPFFEFGKDAAGDVYQLLRAPNVLSNRSIQLCGCGPVGSGAAPHVEQVVYELPAGATFRGAVTLAYDVKLYAITWSGTDQRGDPCQPPP